MSDLFERLGDALNPVDKVKEEWDNYCLHDPYGRTKKEEELASFVDFQAGFKSRDKEINILKQTIQIVCNNLKVNQKGTAIDLLGDIDVWALLDLIKESE